MTMSHNGTSRGRRGALLLVALFALTLASIGGLLTHGNTTASAASVAVDNNGHVIIRKVKSANAPAADGTLFSGTVSSPATPWGGIAIGQQTAPITVNFGTVTVTESAPANGWALVGYHLLTSDTQLCPADDASYTKNANGAFQYAVETSSTQVVCVMNTKNAIVLERTTVVCKIVDDNGDGTNDGGPFKFDIYFGAQFQQQLTITAHESDGANGVCQTLTLPLDIIFSVTETADRPGNWNGDVAGYPEYQVNNGPVVSGNKVSMGSGNNVIRFHNKTNPRLGAIRVTKQTTINGVNFPSDNGGWHITVKSSNCGVNQTKDTAQGLPYGIVSFTNLPACTDYVVSEDVNSIPGYSAINPATVSGVIVTGDSAVLVEFLNNRLLGLPCLRECGTPTSTPTPVNTPTSTPTPRTTPVTTPTTVTTSTPPASTTEIVQLATPPAAKSTPIAPSTGSGAAANDDSSAALLAAIGLMLGAAGLSAAAIARRRS